jgi:Flp pilus assembly pilin Flp
MVDKHNSSAKMQPPSNKELAKMKVLMNEFLKDDSGQDLIEYTLLMAFVALASAALFIGAGGSIKGIWTAVNTQLEAANTSAS